MTEIDWVKFVIERQEKINGKVYDATEYVFLSSKKFKSRDSRFHFSSATALICPEDINDLGFWIHEFTEMALIKLLDSWEEPWRNCILFEKCEQRIPHIIAFLIERRLSRKFLW